MCILDIEGIDKNRERKTDSDTETKRTETTAQELEVELAVFLLISEYTVVRSICAEAAILAVLYELGPFSDRFRCELFAWIMRRFFYRGAFLRWALWGFCC